MFSKSLFLGMIIFIHGAAPTTYDTTGKHLFICSGQSNMQFWNLNVSFIPILQARFGSENVTISKTDCLGTPISAWYSAVSDTTGGQYTSLINAALGAKGSETWRSITFVFMQGETDAIDVIAPDTYGQSVSGLVSHIKTDLGYPNLNVVVGRINNFDDLDVPPWNWPSWDLIRWQQEYMGEHSGSRWGWFDTDVGVDNVHHTPAGYVAMGSNAAAVAIRLIESNP